MDGIRSWEKEYGCFGFLMYSIVFFSKEELRFRFYLFSERGSGGKGEDG